MGKRKVIWSVMLLWNIMLSCTHEPVLQGNKTLKLIWYKSYETETKADAELGLKWTLSFLGADLIHETALTWNDDTLVVNLNACGFNTNGLKALKDLQTIIENSEEHKLKNGFDLGRFVALTLLSSNHYYAITGVPENLGQFMNLPSKSSLFAIDQSTVSLADRFVSLNDSSEKSISNIFLAYEGHWDSSMQSIDLKEYEVMWMLPNGQLRFGIYDLIGNLKTAADTVFSLGGKPSKCIWCHEININPNFANSTDIEGFKSVDSFNLAITDWQSWLTEYRSTLNSGVDFNQTQDHTYAELLYIGFMQPNAQRLAAEWSLTLSETNSLLKSLVTHNHDEFSFMQSLYFRQMVDDLAPFEVIKVPAEAREESSYEPNLL